MKLLNMKFLHIKDELIKYYGFVSEEFEVETEDGYVLKVFRCYSAKFSEVDRSPILLIPGMYDTSDTFCLSPPDEALGMCNEMKNLLKD